VCPDARDQGIDARINLDNVKAVLTSEDAETLLVLTIVKAIVNWC